MKTKPKADEFDKIIGSNLRMHRKKAGFTQMELAQSVGITFQQIQKYESGANRMALSRAVQICQVIKKPLKSLLPKDVKFS